MIPAEQGETKRQAKRGLVALSDGSIVDDGISDGESFEQSLLIGLAGLGENIPVQNLQKEMVRSEASFLKTFNCINIMFSQLYVHT